MYSKSSLVMLLLTIAAATVVAAPQEVQLRPKGISILPIFECPEDTTLSPVLVLPSVGGPPLTANQYIVCFQGKPLIFNCSEGLFFNPSKLSCDFPYERSAPLNAGQDTPNSDPTTAEGSLDLIPVGPIQVPVSPQYPIPIWYHRRGIYPLPNYPITKPDPSVIMPLPVLPAHPPPIIPRHGGIYPLPNYPITKPDPSVILPLPVMPAHPPPLIPRPVPYY